MVYLRTGYEGSGGHLGTSLREVSGGRFWVDSGVDSGSILDHSWTLTRKPHRNTLILLHLAVGRA